MGLSPVISNGYHYVFFEKFNLIPNKVYIFLFYCTAVTTDKNLIALVIMDNKIPLSEHVL